jgi:Na+/H+-dicarboxylate symporter
MTLATQVLIGLLLGVAVGIFFGEGASVLEPVGTAFIRLLQMTVIPYVTVSLVASLGRLTPAVARVLGLRAGLVLLILWGTVLAVVIATPLAYPAWKTASFFSTTLVKEAPPFDFVSLYIPDNPFYALAESVVPSVVVFSVVLGIALMGIQGKEPVLRALTVVADALMAINRLVARLTPLGVFAITASAAGTMGVEELGRLQVHIWTYSFLSLVLAVWVLPSLVAALTPFRYGQIFAAARSPLLLSFATGSLLIVLPMLVDRSRQILGETDLDEEESASAVEVIIPASFNFPTVGKLLTLTFVLFGGWLSGSAINLAEMPTLLISGLASFFGQVVSALPFLLDLMRLPADLFQVYVVTSVVSDRFSAMVSTMHTLALALLGSYAMLAPRAVRWRRLVPWAAISVASVIATLLIVRVGLSYLVDPEYKKYGAFIHMGLRSEGAKASALEKPPDPLRSSDRSRSRLQLILDRGSIRSCYFNDALPFAFQNADGALVGHDVELAHQLARDMGVSLHLVMTKRQQAAEFLKTGVCDIVMSGVAMTSDRALEVAYSKSYLEVTLGFAVRDHLRHEFSDWNLIRRSGDLTIAMPTSPHFKNLLREQLPDAKLVAIETPREFFRADEGTYDALAYAAEAEAAWTLVYPNFTVTVPLPAPFKGLLAFPLPRQAPELLEYLNNWIQIKQHDGSLAALYDYWILGKEVEAKEPRWSVIRNVLHWTD